MRKETIKIYGRPRFCNTHFDVWLACLNLSGVTIGKDACAPMSSIERKVYRNNHQAYHKY
ncbi:hypothetical protein GPY53_18705 [Photorhabdus laumondii subsp. laumondii]|nr:MULTISPECIES: hypothetical protein [Photorhabdus]MCC8389037.1 hypothetical protein [Photorhabdus laumondii]AXG43053.1 hypothetical protein PluDJC_12885 [Photorhabdus laumondii subsp. laumondii]AXG47515.1 hypothetical protein PluTT01m_12560 [Photorhabdus laumondii subsp. laumondii]MCZ1250885.1 hypothetical protein [Photorhabdus laumondii subsp. laumondii]NDL18329.1 hypothetical protein [Photorhabdus laumondii subsp. laumondii]